MVISGSSADFKKNPFRITNLSKGLLICVYRLCRLCARIWKKNLVITCEVMVLVSPVAFMFDIWGIFA